MIDVKSLNGFELESYGTASNYQVAELTNAAEQRRLTVTVYSTSGVPHHRVAASPPPTQINPASGEPAGTVNGAPAYWLPVQGVSAFNGAQGLAWQWAPDAWALLTVTDTTSTVDAPVVDVQGQRAEAAELAALIQLGTATPVTSPIAASVPDCTRLAYTSLVYGAKGDGTPFAQFGLGFSYGEQVDATNPLLTPSNSGPALWVGADTAAAPEDKPGLLVSTVDGYRSQLTDCTAPDRCNGGWIYDVDGIALELRGSPERDVDVLDLYPLIEVYPGATNESNWGPPIMS
jgi:hypothetical protein